MTPRERRIVADWESLRAEYSGHERVSIEPLGPAPFEEYVVTYRVPGLCLDSKGKRPEIAGEHQVRIQLPLDYPREAPYCTPETPVFHPNIAGHVCIGDYWAAGEQLVDIVAKISDMLQYRLYNPASPLDVDAADYARENPGIFPVGNIEVYQPEVEVNVKGAKE